jgi:thiamine-phosphate pyrophosphorylase
MTSMKSKKKLLKESLLYLVVDKKQAGSLTLCRIAAKFKNSAPDIVQFRDKKSDIGAILRDAFFMRKALAGTPVIFIVNDYLDVAKIVDSDGVHLGQSDTSINLARSVLGPEKIIGVSCHNLEQALLAQKNGADYIGLGPIFPTPTKPEYKSIGLKLIKDLKVRMRIPFFVIGGVNLGNINRIVSSGAKRVAVCRAILKAKDIPSTIKKFSTILH